VPFSAVKPEELAGRQGRRSLASAGFNLTLPSGATASDMKAEGKTAQDKSRAGIASPLHYPVFRRIWTASLLSNLGVLIMTVGAAWTMAQLTSSPDMVALIQTALMLPLVLISTPAGAVADMFDRRIVGLVALTIALICAASLTSLAFLSLASPVVLLVSCFVIGSGMALFAPSWQASVSEQVPAEAYPRRFRSTASATILAEALVPPPAVSSLLPQGRSRPLQPTLSFTSH
jgi:MFS family permease